MMNFEAASKWQEHVVLESIGAEFLTQHGAYGHWLIDPQNPDQFFLDPKLSLILGLGPSFDQSKKFLEKYLGPGQWKRLQELASEKGAPKRIEYYLEDEPKFYSCLLKVVDYEGRKLLLALHQEELFLPWPKDYRVAYNHQLKTNLEGRYVYYNKSYDEVFLGQHSSSRVDCDAMEDIVPTSRENAVKAAEQALQNPGEIVDLQLDKLIEGDKVLNTYWQFIAWPEAEHGVDGVYARGYDVSILQRTQEDLKDRSRELALYYAFFENTYDALQVANVDGGLIYINGEASRRLGIPMAEVQRYKVQDFEPRFKEEEAWREHLDFLRNNEVFKAKSTNRNLESGEQFVVDVVAKLIRISGKEYIVANSRDITEEEQMREEVAQKDRELGLFFNNSLLGAFFMMLPEPIDWDDTVDKDRVLDWVFENQMVTRVNQAMLDQYGYRDENEFIGFRPKDFFMHDLEEGRRIWRRFFDIGRWRLKTNERKLDGSEATFEGDYILIKNDEGKIMGHFGVQQDVTESEKALAELESSKDQLEQLTARIPGVVFQLEQKDHDVAISFLSSAYDNLNLGLARDQLFRKPDLILDRIDRADYSLVIGSMLYSYRKLEPLNLEFRFKDNHGEIRWFQVEARHRENEDGSLTWYGVLSDRTALKRVEEQQSRLVHASRNISDGIMIFDREIRLNWINKAAEEVLGVSRSDALSKTVTDLLQVETQSQADCDKLIAEMQDYRSAQIQVLVKQDRKTSLWVQIEHKPVWNNNGEYLYGLLLIRNVNEMVTKHQEMQKLLDLTADQNKRLQSFTYIVSHNIRSYSANLSGLIQTLEHTEDPVERQQLWSYLNDVSNGLDETIRNLNEVIAVNTNLALQKQDLHLRKQIKAILKIFRLELKEIKGEVQIDLEEEVQVSAVPSYLESIILNLLSNAVRYRSPERELRVTLSYEEEGEFQVLKVQDNGLGIDLKKYGNQLFELYKTFHNNPQSRGLGLYILKSQIEAMGGKVAVSSKVDRGTTFSIFFPKY